MNFNNVIEAKIKDSIECMKKLIDSQTDIINKAANVMIEAVKKSKCIYWFGNGGSAADAQHLSCELVNRFYLNRKALSSISFSENIAVLTAIANDFSFNEIFSRQVEAFVKEGDITVGLSTSGNSENVINGIKKARELKSVTIAFTGETGGDLKGLADITINIPSNDTPLVQQCHIMAGHILCYIIEKEIFKTGADK
ncbi:MAG: SIS domain-containing protein [Spirochaetes bacterium]|nr:SIS domain-containing protein [Spirochaetota bacterium]